MINFPPGLILILGALLLPCIPKRWRGIAVLALPLITLAGVWMFPQGFAQSITFLDYELELANGTRIGRLFATVFCIMAFAGGLFAYRQASTLELCAAFAYAGSAIGVTFAGDLITLLLFWELMAVGSTIIIWCGNTPAAYRASMRYLLVHLFGGMLLMIGIIGHIAETGSIAFQSMQPDSVSNWLILIGFLINAGAPPLSAWLPDAYPEASPSGMVFLSAFTTKTAVFALLVGFPGTPILVPVGLYMVFYGIIYACLENDMRRMLAYSIINQVGFMVVGIGIGTEMALNGVASHAFVHIIYKALLLMSAGSVLLMTGKRKYTELGGLFQCMPVTAFCGIIGALATSSFPYTSGFISKSMISQGAADLHLAFVWFMLVAASAGVCLYPGIKFPWFTFFQKDSGLRPDDPPWNMKGAMWIFTFFCIAIGVYPKPLYDILPFAVHYEPYTGAHLVAQCQLLLFAGLAFFIMLPMMKCTETISLDVDWLYRRVGFGMCKQLGGRISHGLACLAQVTRLLGGAINEKLLRYVRPEGVLARTHMTGSMAIWVGLALGLVLIFAFV